MLLAAMICSCIWSCKEEGRFEIGTDDSLPPAKPVLTGSSSLYGGARLYFTPPDDKDLLNVEAAYTNPAGRTFYYAASFYSDSLDVYGFPGEGEYTVDFYAVDRAGNKSEIQKVKVEAKESSVSLVAKSIFVKPAVRSFYVNWTNEVEQMVNVYVAFTFNQDGNPRELTSVFSSSRLIDRHYVYNLDIPSSEKVGIKIVVEDMYGNRSEEIDAGPISLMQDEMIPKDKWFLPLTNDSVAGIPQCFGNANEARVRYLIDGIVDGVAGEKTLVLNLNFMYAGGQGRTGLPGVNSPWNVLIDLGGYYELSRVVTHQRWWLWSNSNSVPGIYYKDENVKNYRIYILDEATNTWELMIDYFIPTPEGLSDLEISRMGRAGDETYLNPDEPGFSRRTRWFRYEAIRAFNNGEPQTLSEITIYGRPAQ
jgi:hypothetical protein